MLSNPAAMAHAPKRRPLASAASRAWNAQQLRAFLDITVGHRFQSAFWLAAHTGMRRGELLGLRCGDVDLDAATTFRESLAGVGRLRAARETRQDRAPLDGVSTSTRAPSTCCAPNARPEMTMSMCSRADSGSPYHPQLLSDAFKKLVHRSELPRIRLHDLRHTHATLLFKAGVPVKVVSERLGHSTPGFTMATYQHVLPGMQAEAAKTFADLLVARLPDSTR